MKDTPLIIIVLLTWNNKIDTLECICSLQTLTYPNFKIVLVDNGSTDGTQSIVKEKYPEIKIMENDRNLGYAEGNNVGIKFAVESGAKFILLLNNDTIVRSDLLDKLIATANNYPEFGVLSPKIYWYKKPKLVWFAGAEWVLEKANFLPTTFKTPEKCGAEYPYETDYASGCAMFFRSRLVSEIGQLDQRFFLVWEEADWCYRARNHGYKIMIEPNAKIWHKVSSSFTQGSNGAHYQYYYSRNRLLWIEKNLRGRAKINAYKRCIRELYWSAHKLFAATVSNEDKKKFTAKLLGTFHYLVRKFGSGPEFLVS